MNGKPSLALIPANSGHLLFYHPRRMPSLGIPGLFGSPILGAVDTKASNIFGDFPVTNSIVVAAIVLFLVMKFAKKATTNMTLIPHKAQNFFELVVEFLYTQVEGIVGKRMAPKAFPLIATIFLFVVLSNWLGLVPGVGTIGFGTEVAPLSVKYISDPLLRPATADLNMTLAIAITFMVVWSIIIVRDIGVGGFLKHVFLAPSGLGLGGVMKLIVGGIFLFVGVIEMLSIAARPLSLSLRLFGNIFAGESLLHVMGDLTAKLPFETPWFVDFLGSIAFPIPFYFLEILVGLLQGLVFALLCAVYIQLLGGDHEEGEHH